MHFDNFVHELKILPMFQMLFVFILVSLPAPEHVKFKAHLHASLKTNSSFQNGFPIGLDALTSIQWYNNAI